VGRIGGRDARSRFYLTGDFTTALSSIKLAPGASDVLFETRPRTPPLLISGLSNSEAATYSPCSTSTSLRNRGCGEIALKRVAGFMVRF